MYENNTVLGRRRQQVRDCVSAALHSANKAGALEFDRLPDFAVESPREAAHGDYAVNIAMLLAKPCRKSPRDIAKIIAEHIDFTGTPIATMEIAGPGFINFRMKEGWLNDIAAEIVSQGADFGRSDSGKVPKFR